MTQPTRSETIADGRRRVVIEQIEPQIDCGRFPIKRTPGEPVDVRARVFTDGHDEVACAVRYRRAGAGEWSEVAMKPLGDDVWHARFRVDATGRHDYTVVGWIDHFTSWRRDLGKRLAAGQDVTVDLRIGADLVDEAASRATGDDAEALARAAGELRAGDVEPALEVAMSGELAERVARYPDRRFATTGEAALGIEVERERARYGAWYELFPRSCGEGGRHGTFRDCEARLDDVASMGFDVLYLPPIHPIGTTARKGRNNAAVARPDDVGSPWAIGAADGGHTAVHPELGTLDDFRRLVDAAAARGIEVALDLAFQASPDHPWVREHPEWFRRRPDGTIQYAENPPKKYQDIYPFDFESERWRELWEALRDVVVFWIEQGVRIFRVDNPHTKPFPFWEWLIAEVRRGHPDVLFLSEAFTRPAVMYRLAKLGFSQSYTYFAWRNTKHELTAYLEELTRTARAEYFRPNLWPNTPDILTEVLQHGGRPAFISRFVLAATLGASYGIYGPAFELMESRAREPGSEEYLDSEKYQIRAWPLDRPDGLRDLIARVNAIRRANPALQRDRGLRFHPVGNDHLIAYTKQSDGGSNLILTVVNLDPFNVHWGPIDLPLDALGIAHDRPYVVDDLLGGERYAWQGPTNWVGLDPGGIPAHIFRVERHPRDERDFEHFI